jgi:6-phosphogluconolactonase
MQEEPLPKASLRVFPSLEVLSHEAAVRFCELARQSVGEKHMFSVALSGGSTPRRLYALLASPVFSIPWEGIHLFQVDERCVPLDHPESNYRMMYEAMLSRAPIPEANFHRMAAELEDREGASRQYAAELSRILQPGPGEIPHLDLVLLGMGPDGHTASLFPGTAALRDRSAWVRPNFVEQFMGYRLTLTLPMLNAATRILFLVAGADKAETLRRVLEGPRQPEELPVQYVQPATGQVEWYVDENAARLLNSAMRSES